MMHIFAQFRLCVLATKAYCYKEVRNHGKILSKTLLKMAGGGCIDLPHIPPWIRPWLYNNKMSPQI